MVALQRPQCRLNRRGFAYEPGIPQPEAGPGGSTELRVTGRLTVAVTGLASDSNADRARATARGKPEPGRLGRLRRRRRREGRQRRCRRRESHRPTAAAAVSAAAAAGWAEAPPPESAAATTHQARAPLPEASLILGRRLRGRPVPTADPGSPAALSLSPPSSRRKPEEPVLIRNYGLNRSVITD